MADQTYSYRDWASRSLPTSHPRQPTAYLSPNRFIPTYTSRLTGQEPQQPSVSFSASPDHGRRAGTGPASFQNSTMYGGARNNSMGNETLQAPPPSFAANGNYTTTASHFQPGSSGRFESTRLDGGLNASNARHNTTTAVYEGTEGNPRATSLATALDRTQERLVTELGRADVLEADLNSTLHQLDLARQREQQMVRDETRLGLQADLAKASATQSSILQETAQDTSRALARDLNSTAAQLEQSARSFYATKQQLELTQVDAQARAETLEDEIGMLRKQLDRKGEDNVELHSQLMSQTSQIRALEESRRYHEEVTFRLETDLNSTRQQLKQSQTVEIDAEQELEEVVLERDQLETTMREQSIRIDGLKQEIAERDADLDRTRAECDKLERESDFNTTVLEQSKSALLSELDVLRAQAHDREKLIDTLRHELHERGERIRILEGNLRNREDELHRRLHEIHGLGTDSDKLKSDLQASKKKAFELNSYHEQFAREARLELEEMQARLKSTDVEQSVVIAQRTNLKDDVMRLTNLLAERDGQMEKLRKLLAAKDQTIAEMQPLMSRDDLKQAKARRAVAKSSLKY